MGAIAHSGPRPRKRRHALRIVLIALAVAAVAEPIVMYRILERQKRERQTVSGGVLPFFYDIDIE